MPKIKKTKLRFRYGSKTGTNKTIWSPQDTPIRILDESIEGRAIKKHLKDIFRLVADSLKDTTKEKVKCVDIDNIKLSFTYNLYYREAKVKSK